MIEFINRSPAGFTDMLCKRLEDLLASFWQEAENFDDGDNEDYHIPHVHAQNLPISLTADDERNKTKDFPYVQVVCNEGVIGEFSNAFNGSELHIQILLFGYRNDPDHQGWRISQSMMWRVLQDLLDNTVLGGYQLIEPVKWSLPISEEPPYYAATIETIWKGAPPAVETPNEGVTTERTRNENVFQTN